MPNVQVHYYMSQNTTLFKVYGNWQANTAHFWNLEHEESEYQCLIPS